MRPAYAVTAALACAAVIGCAHAPAAPTPSTTPTLPAADAVAPELRARAAALFDAAAAGDRPRLAALVDWSRFRAFAALQQANGNAERAARSLSQMEADPGPSDGYVHGAAAELAERLAAFTRLPLPPPALANEALAPWQAGPPPGSRPALTRLGTLVAESLPSARALGYALGDGGRLVLVFLDEGGAPLLVGLLTEPARLPLK